jgi:hypothetical protein
MGARQCGCFDPDAPNGGGEIGAGDTGDYELDQSRENIATVDRGGELPPLIVGGGPTETPAHWEHLKETMFDAIRAGDQKTVNNLIESSSQLKLNIDNIFEMGGEHTPLMLAARVGTPSVAQTLISHGANPFKPSCSDNWTPFLEAEDKGHEDLVIMFRDFMAKEESVASAAVGPRGKVSANRKDKFSASGMAKSDGQGTGKGAAQKNGESRDAQMNAGACTPSNYRAESPVPLNLVRSVGELKGSVGSPKMGPRVRAILAPGSTRAIHLEEATPPGSPGRMLAVVERHVYE